MYAAPSKFYTIQHNPGAFDCSLEISSNCFSATPKHSYKQLDGNPASVASACSHSDLFFFSSPKYIYIFSRKAKHTLHLCRARLQKLLSHTYCRVDSSLLFTLNSSLFHVIPTLSSCPPPALPPNHHPPTPPSCFIFLLVFPCAWAYECMNDNSVWVTAEA